MDDKEILRAKLQATPRPVFLAVAIAVTLAGLNAARILWGHQLEGKPLSRGFTYAALIGFLIVSQSLALVGKSKFGYVVIMLCCLAPALGSLGLSLHLLVLLIEGNSAQDRLGIVISLLGLLQFITIIVLFTTLLRREVRDWVWKNATPEVALT